MERESIRQMLDLKSVQVALLNNLELYRYLSYNPLENPQLEVNSWEECDKAIIHSKELTRT